MDDHNNNFLSQLDEAVKILCRLSEQLHGNADAPAPVFSPPPQLSDDGKTIFFPASRAGRDITEHGAAVFSQKEVSITFSMEEISKMPRYFRKLFRANHKNAHVRLKSDGLYEIRIQIDGVRISASSRFLDEAKIKFLQKLKLLDKGALTVKQREKKILLCDYMQKWLDTVKRPYIKPNTYKMYLQLFNAYILPNFENRSVSSLSQFDLQEFINDFSQNGKNRTAQKLALLLSAVLDYAADDGIIPRSPMKRVIVPRYEEEHGEPLKRDEEGRFISDFISSPDVYKQAYVFMTYTGVRRSELASVSLSGDWVTVSTSKQRLGQKEKLRRIPVSPMLAPLLPLIDLDKIKALSPGVLTKHFKDLFPSHHLHDLRHTFITRAQECGIQRELVSLWAGHSPDSSITSSVYTHLEQNEEHQREEMNKFFYRF